MKKSTFTLLIYTLFIVACATTAPKEIVIEQKQSASKYYNAIKNAITTNNLELADKLYLSLRGEHMDSEFIPSAALKLSEAHMATGEYLLQRYYASAYAADYPTGKKIDYAYFLMLKSTFLRFKSDQSGQDIQRQFIAEKDTYTQNFSHGKYIIKVQEMMKKFNNIRRERNEKIAIAYEKQGKLKAAEYYRAKNKEL